MREIGGNTGGVDNIVEGKLVNKRAGLQEERERLYRTTIRVRFDRYIGSERKRRKSYLANTTRGTENSYFQKGMGLAKRALLPRRDGECLPALTMMDDVLGYRIQIGNCFDNEKLA